MCPNSLLKIQPIGRKNIKEGIDGTNIQDIWIFNLSNWSIRSKFYNSNT